MTLTRSRQALDDAQRAVHELRQTRNTEDFVRRYRAALSLLMAVGPVINSETPTAPKDWWKPHVEPDGSALMKLRTAVLKENDDSLEAIWRPATMVEGARLRHQSTRSYALMPGVPAPELLVPHWTITKGHYKGKDAIAVLETYLPRLDTLLELAAANA